MPCITQFYTFLGLILITVHYMHSYVRLARSVAVIMHFKGAAAGRAGPDFRLLHQRQLPVPDWATF